MRKLKVLLLMLFVSLFFACKTAPKNDKPKQAAPEEKIEQPAAEQPKKAEEMQPVQAAEPKPLPAKADYTIYFAPRTYEIDLFTAQKLDNIAEELALQNVKKIIICGHSAKLDSEKDEERIALQRAIAVARYFQETNLFDTDNISIEGKGAREPAGQHSEIADRFKNRRVEIKSAE